MSRPNLVQNLIVKAIRKRLGLKKRFVVRTIIKKYCNLDYIGWK